LDDFAGGVAGGVGWHNVASSENESCGEAESNTVLLSPLASLDNGDPVLLTKLSSRTGSIVEALGVPTSGMT